MSVTVQTAARTQRNTHEVYTQRFEGSFHPNAELTLLVKEKGANGRHLTPMNRPTYSVSSSSSSSFASGCIQCAAVGTQGVSLVPPPAFRYFKPEPPCCCQSPPPTNQTRSWRTVPKQTRPKRIAADDVPTLQQQERKHTVTLTLTLKMLCQKHTGVRYPTISPGGSTRAPAGGWRCPGP